MTPNGKLHPTANRFTDLFDGHWIANTNFNELLADLDWQQATQQIGTLNTIAALTFHVNYYIGGLVNVFKGGGLEIRDKYSFDLPPIQSEEDWTKLQNELWSNAVIFAEQVGKMTEEILDGPFVEEKYGTYRRNIEAMIEHGYYHLGQVAMLKKMIKAQ